MLNKKHFQFSDSKFVDYFLFWHVKNSRVAGKTLKRNLEFSIKKPGNTLEKPWNFVLKKVWQPWIFIKFRVIDN